MLTNHMCIGYAYNIINIPQIFKHRIIIFERYCLITATECAYKVSDVR